MTRRSGNQAPVIQKAINTERKAEVWELKVKQGLSVKGIADMMGLSTSTIYVILRDIIRTAQLTLDDDVFRWKMEQHYKYDHLYAESMAAWENSKQSLRRDKIKRAPSMDKKGNILATAADNTPIEISTTTENQVGDSRFLTSAIAALTAQAKLWGFNAPDMVESFNRNLTITAQVPVEQTMDAVRVAEAAFRERKFGTNGQHTARTLPELTGSLVPRVREDNAPDEGTDSL